MTDYAIYTVLIAQVIIHHSTTSKRVTILNWLAGGCVMGIIYPLLDGTELNLFNFLSMAFIYMALTFFIILDVIIENIMAWNRRTGELIATFLTLLAFVISVFG